MNTNEILDLIGRNKELFLDDIQNHDTELKEIVSSSTFLVIGGAGTIGQAVAKEIFKRNPKKLHIVDINENNLTGLNDFQQYYVNVYAQNFVGLKSEVISNSFYYFGSLIGDSDGDWDIDFIDYAYFISNYPGIDIAPVTGSAPYFFPNYDGISDQKDLDMFESQWNWSLSQGLSLIHISEPTRRS